MSELRPSVSVVVPFAGDAEELTRLIGALQALQLRAGDELIIADNRAGAEPAEHPKVSLIAASGVRTPAFARNVGARAASGEWLVFIDADTTPAPSLIEDYFEPEAAPETAVLAGWVIDVPGRPTLTSRHGAARRRMSQLATLERAQRPYAQTANCAVRRRAFEQVGGFAEEARAGEDADLCFRLQDAGWRIEQRRGAAVEHRSRDTALALVRQLLRHGSGAAWLNRRYPGTFPPVRPSELARRVAHSGREAIVGAAHGDRDAAAFALLDLSATCAFELGRLLPNRPRPA